MNVAIYGRILQPDHAPFVEQLLAFLVENGHRVLIEETYGEHLAAQQIELPASTETCAISRPLPVDTNVVLSLGGDGTLLNSIMLVKNSGVPVMGVNIGRLGFLTSTGKTDIEQAIKAIEAGDFQRDRRSLLQFSAPRSVFGQFNFALNEFTLHKLDTSSMITIHAYLDGRFLNSYWADGLIVSTPTGSTGYSLSCGGPIILPDSQAIVMTPVAPHNLNVRPLVLPPESKLSFEVESRSPEYSCTLDSRSRLMHNNERITICQAPFSVDLVRFDGYDYLKTLRGKLMWGLDSRNAR